MKNELKRGQVVLLAVLIVAAVATIGVTIVSRSIDFTKDARIEEEVGLALVSAESALDEVLSRKGETSTSLSFSELGIFSDSLDSNKSLITIEKIKSDKFISPLIRANNSYTFYFADYNGGEYKNHYDGNAIFHGASQSVNCNKSPYYPAFELIFFYKDGSIKRRIIEPCDGRITPKGMNVTFGDFNISNGIETANFKIKVDLGSIKNVNIVVIRVLFEDTKIAITVPKSKNLPSQGRYITAEANTINNISKKVRVFQGHPQVPVDFLITKF